mmetsp:Transcript_137866/g.264649  ORF Transcript_137866/g.264649 Transcript_137866/m.264649 type:complete len:88 (-) Transcript_137866:83-346(-)
MALWNQPMAEVGLYRLCFFADGDVQMGAVVEAEAWVGQLVIGAHGLHSDLHRLLDVLAPEEGSLMRSVPWAGLVKRAEWALPENCAL